MKKVFTVKVIFVDGKEKVEIVSAEDELNAIDLIMEQYKGKDVIDIKVI